MWNPIAACAPLPPAPANGGETAVTASGSVVTLTLTCPSNATLIGAMVSRCSSGSWSPPLGTCVFFPPSACRAVTTAGGTARCAANEIVAGGGGACPGQSFLFESRPDDTLQAWHANCFSAYPTVITTALCCLADSTTFLDTPVAYTEQLSSPSAVLFSALPSSSFQQCERVTGTSCPSGKMVLAGGAACAIGDIWLWTNQVTAAGTGFSAACAGIVTTATLPPAKAPAQVTLACCAPFAAPACTFASASVSNGSTGALCSGSNSLVAAGFDASHSSGSGALLGVGMNALTFPSLDSLAAVGVAYESVMTSVVGLQVSGLCCPFVSNSQVVVASSITCPYYEPVPANGLGTIASASPSSDTTNALGATWTLNCPTQYSYLNGSAAITCTASGQWSPAALGQCELINDDQCVSVYVTAVQLGIGSPGVGVNPSLFYDSELLSIHCPSEDWVMTNAASVCGGVISIGVPTSQSSWTTYCGGNGQVYLSATCCPPEASPFLSTCRFNNNSLACGDDELAVLGGGWCWPYGISSSVQTSNQTNAPELTNAWAVTCTTGTAVNPATVCCANPNPAANSAPNPASVLAAPAVCSRANACSANQLALASSFTCPAPGASLTSTFLALTGPAFSALTSATLTCSTGSGVVAMTCCNSFDLCHSSNIPDNVNLQGLTLYWPDGGMLRLNCLPGYEFAGGRTAENIACAISVGGQREQTLPDCYPRPCAALSRNGTALPGPQGRGYGFGHFSAITGLTGDEVTVACDPGYALAAPPLAYSVLTCGSPAGSFVDQMPVWMPNTPTGSPSAWCEAVAVPAPALNVSFVSQYAYTLSWPAFNTSALPLSYAGEEVQWQLTMQLLFPLPSQLSASNAAESGLATELSVKLDGNVQSYTIVLDQYRHIEGTLSAVSLYAFVGGYSSVQSQLLVQAPCGCNLSSPAGAPFNVSLVQSFDAENSLDLTLLPQSLCNPDYQIVSYTALPANGPISAANASLYFPPLPLLQTYYGDNADSCPYLSYVSTPVAGIEWQMTGLMANYCVNPAPQPICTACVPLYIAGNNTASTSGSNATEPSIATCVAKAIEWWGEVSGSVLVGSDSSTATVPGVLISAVITDSNGVPRIFDAHNGQPGGLVQTQVTTDQTGSYSLIVHTPLVQAEETLTIALTASRVDHVTDASQTVLSGLGELVQLASSAAVLYSDGSNAAVTNVNTTVLAVTSKLSCPQPTLTHKLTAAAPAAQTPFAFCALLWGSGWTVALSGVLSTETAVVGNVSVTSTNGVPYVAAAWPLLTAQGTRQYQATAGATVQSAAFTATYSQPSAATTSAASASSLGGLYASEPLLFVYTGLDDYYTYTGQALGVGADQPSPFSHVIDASVGLPLTATGGALATLPGITAAQSAFGLVFDPQSAQYREVARGGAQPQLAQPAQLSSFTYAPLSSVGSVAALGCSVSVPRPPLAYNASAVLAMAAEDVAWFTFDSTLADVTGHVGPIYAVGPGSFPTIDNSVARYGNGSLLSTPQSQYLSFALPPLLFTSTFSAAAWLLLDPTALTSSVEMPIVATSAGLQGGYALSLLYNLSTNAATLLARFPPATPGAISELSAALTESQLPAGVWTHVALAWAVVGSNAAVSFFVDGSLAQVKTVALTALGASPASASAICIAGAPGSPSFSGWLDDVQLYNSSLSSLQVQQLAAYGLPTREVPSVQLGVAYPPTPSFTVCDAAHASRINVTATVTTTTNTTVVTTRNGLGSGGVPLVSRSTYASTSRSSVTWTQPWNASALQGKFDVASLALSGASAPRNISVSAVPANWSTDPAGLASSSFSQPAFNLSRVLANLALLGQLDPSGTQPAAPFLLDGQHRWVSPDSNMATLVQPVTLYLPNAAVNSSGVTVRGPLAAVAMQQLALATQAAAIQPNASTLSLANSSTSSAYLANATSVNATVPSVNPFAFIGQQGERDVNVSSSALTSSTYVTGSAIQQLLVPGQARPSSLQYSTLQLAVQLGSGVVLLTQLAQVQVNYSLVNATMEAANELALPVPLTLTLHQAQVAMPVNSSTNATITSAQATVVLQLTGAAVMLPGSAQSIVAAQPFTSSTPGSSVVLTMTRVVVNATLSHSLVQATTQLNATGLLPLAFSASAPGYDFIDQSVVSVSGRVIIAPSALLPGIGLCGQVGIIVQAFAATDVQLINPLYSSQPTGVDGSFTVDVLANQAVVVAPALWGNRSLHSFSPSTINFTASQTAVSSFGLQFADTTLSTLTVNIVGGLCAAPIGQVTPVLVVDSCGSQHFPLPPMSWEPRPYVLPAMVARFVGYTAEIADASGLQIPAQPDSAQLQYQNDVDAWLVANAQLQLNLTVSDLTTTFVYTAPTNINLLVPVSITPSGTTLPCTDPSTGLQFDVFPSAQPLTFVWSLSETYGVPDVPYSGVLTCGQVNTTLVQLWVHDQLSDDTSDPCVAFGCAVQGTFNPTTGQTLVQYSTTLGVPYPFTRGSQAPPYTRDLHYGEADSTEQEEFVVSLLLTGAVEYEGVTTIKLPPAPSSVLMTLRDPPGGGSFTSWASSYTVVSTLSVSSVNAETYSQSRASTPACAAAADAGADARAAALTPPPLCAVLCCCVARCECQWWS